MATTVAERIVYGRPFHPRAGTVLIGRILLSVMFFISGFAKLTDHTGTVAHMESQGIPAAGVLAYVAALAEILGAAAIAAGMLTRIAAVGLILFLIPTTLIFHDFWTFTGDEQRMQMIQFLKNLTIMGGLALLFAVGPGRYSVDAKLRPGQSV